MYKMNASDYLQKFIYDDGKYLSQCRANQLTCFYMMTTLAFNELKMIRQLMPNLKTDYQYYYLTRNQQLSESFIDHLVNLNFRKLQTLDLVNSVQTTMKFTYLAILTLALTLSIHIFSLKVIYCKANQFLVTFKNTINSVLCFASNK